VTENPPPSLRVTILGSGSSGGVPRPGGPDGRGDWGKCDPQNPKNRRTRCSILVERPHPDHGYDHRHTTAVLVDTSPDMREQLLRSGCSRLDAVLYTHDHADQTHGIDDLRVIALTMRQRVPVYIDPHTAGALTSRFRYCFEQAPGSPYPPILEARSMPACGNAFEINGPAGPIPVMAFLQEHGTVDSLGFRFGDIAYSSDVSGLPPNSFDLLAGTKIWILDALREEAHGSHAHLDLALDWAERVGVDRAILTNLHVTMDYDRIAAKTPANVEPAYDQMCIEV